MGVNAKVCRVDDEDRVVFEGEESEELGLDDEGYLPLDKSWGALQTMIASVTAIDLFMKEALSATEVGRLAKVLKPLPWRKAVDTCEPPDDEDLEEIEGYFTAFRTLVLAASEEGRGLRCIYP